MTVIFKDTHPFSHVLAKITDVQGQFQGHLGNVFQKLIPGNSHSRPYPGGMSLVIDSDET